MVTLLLEKVCETFTSAPDATASLTVNSSIELVLGRSDVTGIADKRCSREHLRVWLDVDAEEVVFQQIGANASCVHFKDEETILSKNLVKRIPLGKKEKLITIYLIQKDHQYGYKCTFSGKPLPAAEQPLNGGLTLENGGAVITPTNSLKRKIMSQSTLDGKVLKQPKLAKKNGAWCEVEKFVYVLEMGGTHSSSKVAAFDMDGTLITTASGAKWPKNKDDWKLLFPEVPAKLKQLYEDGFKLAVFTNQASIAGGTLKATDIQEKIVNLIDRLGVPMQAIIAGTKHGYYRKPAPGMWEHIITKHNDGIEADLSQSIYVGDAAGRPEKWKPGKKKDFACSDRLFALNIGVKFATPEAFFKGEKEAAFEMPDFDPRQTINSTELLEPSSAKLKLVEQEMVVMVGFPGSGKSFVSTRLLDEYKHVNRDKLGSWQKCVARAEEYLKSGSSVVVDNTNPDPESRSRYISLAKKYNVPVRCFLMSASYKQARHHEKYRQLTDASHKSIPEMVFHSYKSKYTEPRKSEGFLEIIKVNFVPNFDNEDQKRLYMLYLLDK